MTLNLGLKRTMVLSAGLMFMMFISCTKNLQKETVVYDNNFETGDLSDIKGGAVASYNGGGVLGRYNNGSFVLTLNNLPKHDLVQVSFDLNIHDYWDGNSTAVGGIEGPDIWGMKLNGSTYIHTTFSNTNCDELYCKPQSYPANFPVNYIGKANAYDTTWPGACSGVAGNTTVYKIVKTVPHKEASLILECYDQLRQMNVTDALCDESWSVDNLKIKVIELR